MGQANTTLRTPTGDNNNEFFSPNSDLTETPSPTVDAAGANVAGGDDQSPAEPNKLRFGSPGSTESTDTQEEDVSTSTGGDTFNSLPHHRRNYGRPSETATAQTYLEERHERTIGSTNKYQIEFQSAADVPKRNGSGFPREYPSPVDPSDSPETQRVKKEGMLANENANVDNPEDNLDRGQQLQVALNTPAPGRRQRSKLVSLGGISAKKPIPNKHGVEPPPSLDGIPTANVKLPGVGEVRCYLAPNKDYENDPEWQRLKQKAEDYEQSQDKNSDEKAAITGVSILKMIELVKDEIKKLEESGKKPDKFGYWSVYIPAMVIHMVNKKSWHIQHGQDRMVKYISKLGRVMVSPIHSSKVYVQWPLEKFADLTKRNIVSGNYLAMKVGQKRGRVDKLQKLFSQVLEVNMHKIGRPMVTTLLQKFDDASLAAEKGPDLSPHQKPKVTYNQQSAMKKPRGRQETEKACTDPTNESNGTEEKLVASADDNFSEDEVKEAQGRHREIEKACADRSNEPNVKDEKLLELLTKVTDGVTGALSSLAANQEQTNENQKQTNANLEQSNANHQELISVLSAQLQVQAAERERHAASMNAQLDRHAAKELAMMQLAFGGSTFGGSNIGPKALATLGSCSDEISDDEQEDDPNSEVASSSIPKVGDRVRIIHRKELYTTLKAYADAEATATVEEVCPVVAYITIDEQFVSKGKQERRINKLCLEVLTGDDA